MSRPRNCAAYDMALSVAQGDAKEISLSPGVSVGGSIAHAYFMTWSIRVIGFGQTTISANSCLRWFVGKRKELWISLRRHCKIRNDVRCRWIGQKFKKAELCFGTHRICDFISYIFLSFFKFLFKSLYILQNKLYLQQI